MAVTTLFIVLQKSGVSLPAGFEAGYGAFLDVALFGIIAVGLFRYSRVAACAGLAFYVFEKLSAPFVSSAIIVVIVLTLMFVNGIRGTLAYHRLRKTVASASTPGPIEPL